MKIQRCTISPILGAALVFITAPILAPPLQAQFNDRKWLGGYDSWAGLPYGGNKTLFPTTGTTFSLMDARGMNFSNTVAVLSNSFDSVVAYTNGIYIADITGDTMLNGSGLNPSIYTSETYGCYTANSHILLPWPDATDSVALFHMATDSLNSMSTFVSRHLYMSVLDMAGNGGLGQVVNKNSLLDLGEFCTGGVSACKHANGRDWWVLFHRCTSDEFVRFLLTPSGVQGPWYQAIGEQRIGSVPSGVFTNDGSQFAYVDAFSDLDVFDFDRCSGELSNTRHAGIDSSQSAAFAAYSPSGRFLYVTWVDRVYQFDTYAGDLDGSRMTVAVWDSTYDPGPPFSLLFMNACLAADGKIYLSTGNGSRFMHIIDQPDSSGAGCAFQHHAHNRLTYTDNSIPYRPNYQLGPIDGSVCDSLGINEGVPEHGPPLQVSAYPNPSTGPCTVSYPAQGEVGVLEVRDLSGRLVLTDRLPPWSTMQRVSLEVEAKGLYNCTVRWGIRSSSVRILIER